MIEFIGNEQVAVSVTDLDKDIRWLFTNRWQGRVFHDEMKKYGNNVTLQELK